MRRARTFTGERVSLSSGRFRQSLHGQSARGRRRWCRRLRRRRRCHRHSTPLAPPLPLPGWCIAEVFSGKLQNNLAATALVPLLQHTMALFRQLLDDFNGLMDRNGDPRTKDWPLMSSPFPTAVICLAYIYLVKVIGPRLMENRKPLEMKNLLVFYNFFQVIFSTWLFHEIAMSGWITGHYNFRCQPVDYSNHPKTLRMVHACWWYYFSKFTEFFDTFFFVLRKKNSHVSTLHVIHHGIMPMSVWFGVKFTPGGHSTFFGLVNTFVHIIMYTYYLLAAMGPQYQKYLWWKKYLTTFQMVQFIAIMVHAFQLLFIDCNYPRAFVWWIGLHAVMFYFLFSDFYKQAYTKSINRQKAALKRSSNGKCSEDLQKTSDGETPIHTKEYTKPQAADYYINAVTGLHLRQVTREINENGLQ